jgi:ABC-type antimicrobial peptide transport system permease subunit
MKLREKAIIAFVGFVFMIIIGPLTRAIYYISIKQKERIDLFHIYVEIPMILIGFSVIGMLWFVNQRWKRAE